MRCQQRAHELRLRTRVNYGFEGTRVIGKNLEAFPTQPKGPEGEQQEEQGRGRNEQGCLSRAVARLGKLKKGETAVRKPRFRDVPDSHAKPTGHIVVGEGVTQDRLRIARHGRGEGVCPRTCTIGWLYSPPGGDTMHLEFEEEGAGGE